MIKLNAEQVLSSDVAMAQNELNNAINELENEKQHDALREQQSKNVGKVATGITLDGINPRTLQYSDKVAYYEAKNDGKLSKSDTVVDHVDVGKYGLNIRRNKEGDMILSDNTVVTQEDFNNFRSRFNAEHGSENRSDSMGPKSEAPESRPKVKQQPRASINVRVQTGGEFNPGLADLAKGTSRIKEANASSRSTIPSERLRSSINASQDKRENNAGDLTVPNLSEVKLENTGNRLSKEDRDMIMKWAANRNKAKIAESTESNKTETKTERTESERSVEEVDETELKRSTAHRFGDFLRNMVKQGKLHIPLLHHRAQETADTANQKEPKKPNGNWSKRVPDKLNITDPKLAMEYNDLRKDRGAEAARAEFMKRHSAAEGQGFTVGETPDDVEQKVRAQEKREREAAAAERAAELRRGVEVDYNAEQAKRKFAEMIQQTKDRINELAKQEAERLTKKLRQQIVELIKDKEKLAKDNKNLREHSEQQQEQILGLGRESDRQQREINELKRQLAELKAERRQEAEAGKAEAKLSQEAKPDRSSESKSSVNKADKANESERKVLDNLSDELGQFADQWRWNKGAEQHRDVTDDEVRGRFGDATRLFDLPHDQSITFNEQGRAALKEFVDYTKAKDAKEFDVEGFIKTYNNYQGFLKAAHQTLEAMSLVNGNHEKGSPLMSFTDFLKNTYDLAA